MYVIIKICGGVMYELGLGICLFGLGLVLGWIIDYVIIDEIYYYMLFIDLMFLMVKNVVCFFGLY